MIIRTNKNPRLKCATAATAALLCGIPLAHSADGQLGDITVISSTPLPGLGVSKDSVPAPVQTLNSKTIENTNASSVTDILNDKLGSVYINDIQNNAYQPDLNYRGFTASPLLGTPQGLSVYMDGVRLNQPFGDVVSFDLIPKAALESITLVPGSNPVYGLNTLGGAVSIRTKDGRSAPGTSIELTGGNRSAWGLEFEHGGSDNTRGLNWYLTANQEGDNGWRPYSPSDIKQLFGKLGWANDSTDMSLTLSLADNSLSGNGLQEYRLMQRDYASVYTTPDITNNRAVFVNLAGTHFLNDYWSLEGNLYYRKIKTNTYNGDLGDDPTGVPTPADCMTNPSTDNCSALINRTNTDQDNTGASLQLSSNQAVWTLPNVVTYGVAVDTSTVRFGQTSQLAYLNADRSVTSVPAFNPANQVGLTGSMRTYSLYATDTLTLSKQWYLTGSGRFNRTHVSTSDLLNPGGGPGSLDGDHNFSRFNPAVGVSYKPSSTLNWYAGYNEGSRAPSVIELGCADPNNPCTLPNSLGGDPPLKQVVTKTKELGVRGQTPGGFHWSANVFRADNYDDLLFVASPTTQGQGYFKNFGQTRRQGLELGLDKSYSHLAWKANYTFLDATYQSSDTLTGGANSAQDANGNITVNPGNHIPLVPRHVFKLNTSWKVNSVFRTGLDMIAIGRSYARGNENNQHQADGVNFLGSGEVPGYAIFNLNANYDVHKNVELWAKVTNLFDRHYSTSGLLGATGFDPNGTYLGENTVNSTFYGPGAPRSFWVGLKIAVD
ncbi:MAG TPA: TonB-dependent receptor [Limnobacter sp.]|uniref:TonB-dependent receptor n=1 Tax=Limnobacter sp. TaxID=2003368 RepID=UPI002E318271|nr:TonB-dependent receptor [Limnobacter sp.]HEX5485398.1 TonB-dependent receptor [Limnobacter sp.]